MEKLGVKNPKQANKVKIYRRPLKVVYISNPMMVKASAEEFRSVVQELTGQDSDVDNLFSPRLAEVPDAGAAFQAPAKPGPIATDGGRFDPRGDVAGGGGSSFDCLAEAFSPQMLEAIGYELPSPPLCYELQGNGVRNL